MEVGKKHYMIVINFTVENRMEFRKKNKMEIRRVIISVLTV